MAQLYAVALRVARLAPDGSTPAGPDNLYVTNGVVKVTYSLNYEDVAEIVKRDGQNRVCFYQPASKSLKGVTVSSLDVCEADDPELVELLSDGSLLTDGTGVTMGYAAPAVGSELQPNGISLEVWTRRKGAADAAAFPFAQHLFPRVRLTPRERSIETDVQAGDFEGVGEENPGWGNGPANDWTGPTARAWQWRKVADAPTGLSGYQPTPVQTP